MVADQNNFSGLTAVADCEFDKWRGHARILAVRV